MNMQERLEQLLTYATQKKASDIHLTLHRHTLSIQLRIYEQMVELVQDLWDESLFEYVKFKSGLDPKTANSAGSLVLRFYTVALA